MFEKRSSKIGDHFRLNSHHSRRGLSDYFNELKNLQVEYEEEIYMSYGN